MKQSVSCAEEILAEFGKWLFGNFLGRYPDLTEEVI
jgi:hypothetical protein